MKGGTQPMLKKVSEDKLCKILGCSKQHLTKACEVPSYEDLKHLGWYITPQGNVFEKVVNYRGEEEFVYICCGRVFSSTLDEIKTNEALVDYLN